MILALAFSGCRKSEEPNLVTLRIVVWGTAADEKNWNEKLAEFYRDNPNTRVRFEYTPWERTFDKLLISTAGGKAPDATIVSSVWFVPCASKGLLADLGPFVENDKEFDIEDFYPAAVKGWGCLLYTSPSPRDRQRSRMPSSA